MLTTILLSRHGETKINELSKKLGIHWDSQWLEIPNLESMNNIGEQQVTTLAYYLKYFEIDSKNIPCEDVFIYTSELDRSKDSGLIIRNVLGLSDSQIHSSFMLNEDVPREYAPEGISDEWNKNWWRQRRTKDQIVGVVKGEFEHILRTYSGKTIIAPLHGNINRLMLEYLNIPCEDFANAGLIKLGYENGKVEVITPYQSNAELQLAISQRIK